MKRKEFLNSIKSNINNYGYHITIVSGVPNPRYAYTIGLTETLGFEFVLAGGIYFMKNDIYELISNIVKVAKKAENLQKTSITTDSFGDFNLKKNHNSWSDMMMLGAKDFYNLDKIEAYQILPNNKYHTIDIPNMSIAWDSELEPAWQWLKNDWKYQIPDNITVVTNLDALRGKAITEIMRWEKDEWEMFAGSGIEVNKEDIRVTPIGLLLAIDETLKPALELKIGKGMIRESKNMDWAAWG